ncbi:uncharacterized protein N7477_008415 [Penicillium maclennaniae]|uniref:uncharacterized protein n=1 Tax=Penicillium maclennaniae TaxID=1343394 RepID=UPI002540BA02|nr:uncharacterized protein N7477_008415 [Penicillium maclennaniae]KAJ5665967.1 hypothetical protein N7477_008415 [Penicillium maclennaniae]
MPQVRSLRARGTMNENDENGPSTRLTRAKAAAQTEGPADAIKKPVVKRAPSAVNGARRAALGDVSNFNKADAGGAKDGKKAVAGKAGLTSKAGVKPGGIQKPGRTTSTRGNHGLRDANTKKPAAKRQVPKTNENATSEEPPLKKPNTQQKAPEVEDEPAVKTSIKDVVEEGVHDLDTEDLDDPLMAAEYVVEIFDYLKDLELVTMPNPQYIEHQHDLEWKMRGILVDWLIEVHTRFRLLPETLFLAVNIIDRFLSAEIVALDRLQLVGVTAMFIASKYEEVLSPHVANFSHVADETFSDKEILDAERHVLQTLEYNMSFPNPMNFLRRISKADNYDIQTRTLGKYLMEISLLDHRFMSYPQSHIAAAAMYLARLILERGPWDATLAHYAGKKFLKASILTRQWAKKYHSMYIDSSLSEPYTYIKDEQ